MRCATEHMLSPAQTVCLLQTTPPPLPLSPIMFYKCLGRHLGVSGYRLVRCALLIDVLIAARCCSNKMSAELLPPRRVARDLLLLLLDTIVESRICCGLPLTCHGPRFLRPDRIVIYVLRRARGVGGCRRFNGRNIVEISPPR